MARAELHLQETTRERDGTTFYVVRGAIERAYGIATGLFVFRAEDDAFSHVATVYDLNTYGEAVVQPPTDPVHAFVRRAEVEREFGSKADAAEFSSHLRQRVALVVKDWQADAGVAFGEESYTTYDGEES